MGTRNITEVIYEGKLKVSQYGQWDGYLSGQGMVIANFFVEAKLDIFKDQIKNLKEISAKEVQKRWEEIGADGSGFVSWDLSQKFAQKYPHLHRDCGADVLYLIYQNKIDSVYLDKEFKEDGLFCEFCYTIDLDKETIEVNGGEYGPYALKEWTPDFVEELEKEEVNEEV